MESHNDYAVVEPDKHFSKYQTIVLTRALKKGRVVLLPHRLGDLY